MPDLNMDQSSEWRLITRTRERSVKVEGIIAQRCNLMDFRIVDDNLRVIGGVPYFYCSNNDSYFETNRRILSQCLLFIYPSLPQNFVDDVSSHYATMISDANATHLCPHLNHGVESTITHVVEVQIPYRELMTAMETALRDSFEEAGPVMTPATVKSIQELVDLRSMKMIQEGDRFENGWCSIDCTICMDEIRTRSETLSMPCLHVYHDHCLRQWLKASNVCPLCRYRMPS